MTPDTPRPNPGSYWLATKVPCPKCTRTLRVLNKTDSQLQDRILCTKCGWDLNLLSLRLEAHPPKALKPKAKRTPRKKKKDTPNAS